MPVNDNIPIENASLKVAARATPLVILALLVMAVVFFRERMLYIDAPHMLFRIINDGHMHIEEHRYGSFISQLFPWLAIRLHLPLIGVMMAYSTGFYIFYMVVALLLVYKYRNYGLAILLGLYFTVFVSDTYYWPNNEVHQGIAWLLLAFAVCLSEGVRSRPFPVQLLLFSGLFFLAIWTHPLVMLAAIYLWFFYIIGGNATVFTKQQTLLFSIILVVLSFAKFYQGMHHGYDSGKIETLTDFDLHRLKYIFTSPQFRFFIKGCATRYFLFTALFLAGLVGMLAEKKYLLFAWTILFVAGYLFLTCATYWNFTLRSFMESEYMPLVIICTAPFVYYVLPKVKPGAAVTGLGLVYALRLVFIVIAAAPFSNRVVLLDRMNEKMKQKDLTKMVVTLPLPAGIDSALIATWGAPVEGIFLSALKGQVPQRTFVFLSVDEMKTFYTTSTDTLLEGREKTAARNITSRYFAIDTLKPYQVITYDALMQ